MEIQVVNGATKAERQNKISALKPAIDAEGYEILSEIKYLERTFLVVASKAHPQKGNVFKHVPVPGFTIEGRQKHLATVRKNWEAAGWSYVGFSEVGLNSPAIFCIDQARHKHLRRATYQKIILGIVVVLLISVGYVLFHNYSVEQSRRQEVEFLIGKARGESSKATSAFKKKNWEGAITALVSAEECLHKVQSTDKEQRDILTISSEIEGLKKTYAPEITKYNLEIKAWRAACDRNLYQYRARIDDLTHKAIKEGEYMTDWAHASKNFQVADNLVNSYTTIVQQRMAQDYGKEYVAKEALCHPGELQRMVRAGVLGRAYQE